ncbi:MAG: DUF4349 domain-containing protein [Saprospiraceae bacterium]|nr:DUF4349 domain-containing protein [Lewinellaceae bacterium]
MHYLRSIFPLVFLFLLVSACRQDQSHAPNLQAEKPVAAETDMAATYSETEGFREKAAFHSTSAQANHWDTVKKLVRRAELSFRTPDVLKATLAIEDIVRKNGGFVLENKLVQTVSEQFDTPVSKDSLLETTVFQITNNLVVRVPAKQLDTTLRAIGHWSEQLDYRTITAEDVSLKALEEQLAQLRNQQYQTDLQRDIATNPTKLPDVVQARRNTLAARAAADAATLEQLRLDDAVQLSTLTIALHQRPVTKKVRIAQPQPTVAWTPGLAAQLQEAFRTGWNGLEAMLVFLVGLWPLLFIGALLWWALRKRHLIPAFKK